jgi:hypothetical protein
MLINKIIITLYCVTTVILTSGKSNAEEIHLKNFQERYEVIWSPIKNLGRQAVFKAKSDATIEILDVSGKFFVILEIENVSCPKNSQITSQVVQQIERYLKGNRVYCGAQNTSFNNPKNQRIGDCKKIANNGLTLSQALIKGNLCNTIERTSKKPGKSI